MKMTYIDHFVESASSVIQQVCQVEISRGEKAERDWTYREGHTWIHIGMTGHFKGDVYFGIETGLALQIVSAMMGGFPIQEMDEIGKSAISELGNMISGNASTLLSQEGIVIDISPPHFMHGEELAGKGGSAVTADLELQNMGRFEIQMVVIE
ncbi:chemotaxis protein CheX [Brevibacillus sp. TJ4]|uniref:chemotaxis protein CheX n=1 Tax=Brevibacillus sp. TJ4 TaxID=3234853 RepID=UPI0037CD0041